MDQGQHNSLFEVKMALKQPQTNFQRLLRPQRIILTVSTNMSVSADNFYVES